MLELEENLKTLNSLIKKLNDLSETLKISDLEKQEASLKAETERQGFWDNQETSNKIFANLKRVQRKLESFKKNKSDLDNLIQMNKMLLEEYDEELAKDLINQTGKYIKNLEKLELETLLSGKYDINNAIITLHPGARRYRITRLGANAL